jgi:MFS transporter, DHA1 family, tetracycline resistance protein
MQRKSIIPVLLTYFIDHFGFAIVFLLYGPLVLSQNGPLDISQPEKPLFILFALLVFPLAQCFGAPIFGTVSDNIGRKKTFLISIGGTIIGNSLMALAFNQDNFLLLLIGRLLAGFFAGNLTLCLASLADMSRHARDKVHNFSLLAAVGGFSYIGAILSGDFFSKFAPSTPFWITAGLGVLNICLLLIFFKETHTARASAPFGFWKIITSFPRPFKTGELNHLYVCYFLFMLCWVPSLQFLPELLKDRFQFTDQQNFILLMILGTLWSFSNWLLSRFSFLFSNTVLFRLFLVLASFLALAGALPSASFFMAAFLVTNIGAALTWTYLFVGISNQASLGIQGEILGVSQAIGSIAVIIGLGMKRVITFYFPDQYFLFASFVIFLATLTIGLFKSRKTTS